MHQLRALDDVSLRVEQGEIFRSPLTRIVLVTDVGFVAARTLVILLVLLGGSMSVMATHTVHFPSFWILSTASTSVLSLGIVVNTSLKMLFAEDKMILGPSLVLSSLEIGSVLQVAVYSTDVFALWFFLLLSHRMANVYGERPFVAIALSLLVWSILMLASALLGIRFRLSF